ncbi:Short-chain dehydrogenase/reductase SDR [Macleaya cordata]|uniref:Short-chain dehydrogenase/reductase SDR n=1 Tax=Macleaya cordata TaxID=56857 RepID=A0A200QKQ8_MACCD|nr:Short-chain dehydrogenase/reductase SDR [Macleaya cordata]
MFELAISQYCKFELAISNILDLNLRSQLKKFQILTCHPVLQHLQNVSSTESNPKLQPLLHPPSPQGRELPKEDVTENLGFLKSEISDLNLLSVLQRLQNVSSTESTPNLQPLLHSPSPQGRELREEDVTVNLGFVKEKFGGSGSVYIAGEGNGGEVLAKQLATLGAKLIISARSEAELERVKTQLVGKHAPDGVKVLPLDLTSGEESLREAVQKAESFFPDTGVDYMIHNAAYERPKTSALDVTEESLKATLDVNVLGTITLTRLLAPSMLKRGKGHFVVMSSAAGKTPAPGQAVYSASKYALNGYFHTLRSELCQKGIKVTVVCPGPIETSNGSGASSSGRKGSSGKHVSSERCAELTIIAATHGLKEVWISDQPVLGVMYLVQYMPSIGYWIMDKVGGNRVQAAAEKGNTYSWSLLFGHKKKAA